MKRDKQVYIKVPQIGTGTEGGQTTIYVGAVPTMVSLQPYSGELARMEYGLERDIKVLMFASPNPLLKEKNMIYVSETEKYTISYVARWSKHYECLLEEYDG